MDLGVQRTISGLVITGGNSRLIALIDNLPVITIFTFDFENVL